MVKEIIILVHPYPTGFFSAGSTVTGEAVVKTGSQKSYYKKLELMLMGTIKSNFTDRKNGKRCGYTEVIMRNVSVLWEKGQENLIFPKGESYWPFIMSIPQASNVLPSCENEQTSVKYSLTAIISRDKKGKADSETSTALKIFPAVNISSPNLQEPISTSKVTPFWSCLCMSDGSIDVDVHLRHKSYGIDEVLELEVELDNSTRKRIDYFEAGLIQTVVCGGIPRFTIGRSQDRLLYGEVTKPIGDKVKGNSVIPRSSWAENLILPVPVVPPTFESTNSILSISYHVLVIVYTSSSTIDIKCPVVIGTTHSQGLEIDADLVAVPSDFSEVTNNPPNYFEALQPTNDDNDGSVVPSAPTLPRNSLLLLENI